MPQCDFSIDFSEDADTLINEAETAIKSANGHFNGNSNSGSFQLKTPVGSVAGNYNIENSAIRVQITQKPLLLSCTKIQNELRKFLGG